MEKTIDLYDYKYFNSSKGFQRSKARLAYMLNQVWPYNPKTLLDVGCGLGTFVDLCRKNRIDAQGIDFAPILKEKWWSGKEYLRLAHAKDLPFKNYSFDVVYSADFFEHIPEEDIDKVAREMRRVGKKVLARIAFESNLTENQAKYHCTNKSKEWWQNKLKDIIILDYA